jgi:hypothetical protein
MKKIFLALSLFFSRLAPAQTSTPLGSVLPEGPGYALLTWEYAWPLLPEREFLVRAICGPGLHHTEGSDWPIVLHTREFSVAFPHNAFTQFTVTVLDTTTGQESPFAVPFHLGGWKPSYPGEVPPLGFVSGFNVAW